MKAIETIARAVEPPHDAEEQSRIAAEILIALQELLSLKEGKIHEDIRRGKTIISDAVVKLGNSFNSLNNQTRAQQQLVASLIEEVSQKKAGGANTCLLYTSRCV